VALISSFVDELLDFTPLEILSLTVLIHLGLLIDDDVVLLDVSVELIHLVNADMQEVSLLIKLLLRFDVLIVELEDILFSSLNIMEERGETDNVELLLVDTGIEENSLFVERKELLLKLGLDLDDLSSNSLEIDFPLLLLLLNAILDSLLKLSESDLLVFSHLGLWLVHPVLSDKLILKLVLLFLHDKLVSSHHGHETTLVDIVSSKKGLTLTLSLSLFFHSLSLLFSVESLNLDLGLLIDLEDVIWVLKLMLAEGLNVLFLSKVLLKLDDLIVLLLDQEDLLLLVILKLLELLVIVTLELEDNLL